MILLAALYTVELLELCGIDYFAILNLCLKKRKLEASLQLHGLALLSVTTKVETRAKGPAAVLNFS